MSYVYFENQGVIDERSIKTFGVSVKEGENPIGYFGTGLKYAIAILLRHKQEVKLLAGDKTFVFETKPVTIRSKEFEVITMNGEELPFTTELGKNWELWQAFREIYCNCLDEKGTVDTSLFYPKPEEGKTKIVVTGREFLSTYHQRDSIVLRLPDSLLIGAGEVEVYRRPSEFLYYRGIRVLALSKPAMLTYNITSELELTEDRTVKSQSSATAKLPRAISSLKNKEILREVLTSPQTQYEHDFDFGSISWWEEKISPEFEEVLALEYNFNNDKLNKSARQHHVRVKNKNALKNYEPAELTTVEEKQLERCVRICKRVYEDFDQYKILIVKSLGQTTMALADPNDRMIVISKSSFAMGSKFLLSTMIEEYVHLKTGYTDHSRELQTFLFDSITGMIENHVLGEPI